MQSSSSQLFPSQFLLGFFDLVFVHLRDLLRFPPSQVFEHVDHRRQVDHTPAGSIQYDQTFTNYILIGSYILTATQVLKNVTFSLLVVALSVLEV